MNLLKTNKNTNHISGINLVMEAMSFLMHVYVFSLVISSLPSSNI